MGGDYCSEMKAMRKIPSETWARRCLGGYCLSGVGFAMGFLTQIENITCNLNKSCANMPW